MKKFKVLIEDVEEISNIAQLLFHRTKEEIINYLSDEFSSTFDSEDEALTFIKRFFDDIDEDFYKELWLPFIVVIKENNIINIEQYNYNLELVDEVF